MSRTYLRGDMYYADLGRGVGSEQEGYRPVVIIQNNKGNKHSPTVIVAAISSKVGIKPKLPTHYFINAECGLERPSIVLMEQIRTLDKQRLTKYIGRLTKEHIQGMNCALAVSVDLIHTSLQALNVCLCSPCAAGHDNEVTPQKSAPVMKKQMGQGGATNA
ncbi:MAG: type II toxin-antitoxin system PemK/MazF family toxin [Oscillibacter sp.]|nr:type II toxin-antitoxin system PemK/MazF family toxin [Oscillibacter sp.]